MTFKSHQVQTPKKVPNPTCVTVQRRVEGRRVTVPMYAGFAGRGLGGIVGRMRDESQVEKLEPVARLELPFNYQDPNSKISHTLPFCSIVIICVFGSLF